MAIKSEAKLTTFEAISMIVGNSIGTGIIAVPYLATKNSMIDVIWMVGAAYIINVILHLIIAELSYNNGGVQLVKSFEGELFNGVMKKVFSWIVFVVYGLAIMIGVSGNINGGAQIFENWFGLPLWLAQVTYYVIAGIVVFMGMKAVGIAQKYAVILLMGIVAVMTVGTFTHPVNGFYTAPFHWNNLLALYSMVVFATSANQAVIQVVKGLDGNPGKIRKSIFIGFGLSSAFVLVVTLTVLLGTKGTIDKELAYMQLGESIGKWAVILAGIFSLFALLTTFWSNTLALRGRTYAGKIDCTQAHLTFLQDFLNSYSYDDYDLLIQLCDAISLPNGACILEKRLVDVALRHGVTEHSIDKWKAFMQVKKHFDQLCGCSIYSLLPNVLENSSVDLI